MAAEVVADDAELSGESRHLRIPHVEAAAQRTAEHDDGPVFGTVHGVVHINTHSLDLSVRNGCSW